MFVGQSVDSRDSKAEYVMGVKTFAKESSDTAETICVTFTGQLSGTYKNSIVSVMADTAAVHTAKKSGVNAVNDFFQKTIGHDIHILECLFYVNEINLSHIITTFCEDDALKNLLHSIGKPKRNDVLTREKLDVAVTRMAVLYNCIKSKEWFNQQKTDRNK